VNYVVYNYHSKNCSTVNLLSSFFFMRSSSNKAVTGWPGAPLFIFFSRDLELDLFLLWLQSESLSDLFDDFFFRCAECGEYSALHKTKFKKKHNFTRLPCCFQAICFKFLNIYSSKYSPVSRPIPFTCCMRVYCRSSIWTVCELYIPV